MHQSTVTVKGQVTIPAPIRKQIGLQRGGRVSFTVEDDKVYLKPVQDKVEAAFGLVTASQSASLAQLEAAIKQRAGR
ncbi:MAG: hypothetical protein BWK76_06415 [Desulfobulbaceae bacterium A2]|nr:MAG: hypothetical protein BWK76_06415 [Desulfobulbaceae bacterium A2]